MLEAEVKQRRMTTYSKHCGFQKVAEEVHEYSENCMLVDTLVDPCTTGSTKRNQPGEVIFLRSQV